MRNTVSLRIWIGVAVSISYNGDRYNKNASNNKA